MRTQAPGAERLNAHEQSDKQHLKQPGHKNPVNGKAAGSTCNHCGAEVAQMLTACPIWMQIHDRHFHQAEDHVREAAAETGAGKLLLRFWAYEASQ